MASKQKFHPMRQMLLLSSSDVKANFFDRRLTLPSRPFRCSSARVGRSGSSRCPSSSSTNQGTSSPCPRKACLPEDRLWTTEGVSWSRYLKTWEIKESIYICDFALCECTLIHHFVVAQGDESSIANVTLSINPSQQVGDSITCNLFIQITDNISVLVNVKPNTSTSCCSSLLIQTGIEIKVLSGKEKN